MLSMTRLPWLNLRGYPARTAALLLLSALMAACVLGGTLVVQGVRQGMEETRSRLGADILVTPEDADNEFDAQSVLVQAEPGYFYMPASTLDEVASVPGVDAASPQLFLASARSGCCSGRYQIIAFDPDSDFVIQPWIATAVGEEGVRRMDIVVGSDIALDTGEGFRLFNNDCRVAGRLAPTGSTLDSAIYTNFDTARVLIDSSVSRGLNKYGDVDADNVISSVAVRVGPGYDVEQVAAEVDSRVEGVSVTTSTSMISGIAGSVASVSRSVALLAGITWLVGLAMTVLVFSMMINERRKELATLVLVGASQSTVARMVVREAAAVNLVGGAVGAVVAGVLVGAFRGLVAQVLGVGLVLPGPGALVALAAVSLLLAVVAAVVSSGVAVRAVSRLDASLVLKEGE